MTNFKEERENFLKLLEEQEKVLKTLKFKKTEEQINQQLNLPFNYDGYGTSLPFNKSFIRIKENEGELSASDIYEEKTNVVSELEPLSEEDLSEISQLFDTFTIDNKLKSLLNFKKYYSKISSKYFNLRFQLKTFESGNSNLLTESFFEKWFDCQIQYEIINLAFAKILGEFRKSDMSLNDFFVISENLNNK